MTRSSCHPVKKGFAPFSYIIVFVKRWTSPAIVSAISEQQIGECLWSPWGVPLRSAFQGLCQVQH